MRRGVASWWRGVGQIRRAIGRSVCLLGCGSLGGRVGRSRGRCGRGFGLVIGLHRVGGRAGRR